jgi:hypothetical protein
MNFQYVHSKIEITWKMPRKYIVNKHFRERWVKKRPYETHEYVYVDLRAFVANEVNDRCDSINKNVWKQIMPFSIFPSPDQVPSWINSESPTDPRIISILLLRNTKFLSFFSSKNLYV